MTGTGSWFSARILVGKAKSHPGTVIARLHLDRGIGEFVMAERVSFEKLGPIISDKRPAGQATWIITITGLIGKIRGPIVGVLADAMTPKLFDKR